jgi:WD40 repeat protein
MADAEIKVIHDWIAEGALAQAPQKATAAGAEKPSRIYSLALSPDGKTVATGHYQKVVLSDGRSLNSRSLDGHAGIVRGLRWSKDGRLLIAGGGTPGRSGEIKVWQADGQLQKTFTGHKDAIFAVAISPDGKTIASASYDKLIKLWDVATGQESKTLKDHTDAIYALDFSPDGRFLISGAADRTVKLWHVESGERLFTVSEPGDAVHAVAFAPDGQHFAAAGQDKSIRVWKLEGGAKPKSAAMTATMIAHEDAVLALSYTPDGKHLVSSSADRSLKVFRSADLKEAAVHPGQADWVYGLAVHADGKKIAAASLNGVLQWIPLEVAP